MSHIVIDGRESGTTTGRYVDKLIEHLAKLKIPHSVTILAKPHRIAYLHKIAPAFTIEECGVKEFSLAEQTTLKHQIEQLRPDLVHFPMVQQPVLYNGRVVTTMNDLTTLRFRNPAKNALVFWFKQRVYHWVNKRVARKSNALLTYSDFVRDDVANFTGLPTDKFTTIPLAADAISEPAEPLASLAGKPFIMYVGRPLPHKNLGRLIEAFVALKVTHPDLQLVLAGKTDVLFERFKADVTKRGLQGVIFTDFVSEGQLRWLYEQTVAYVMPSLSEGFGLPGLEAMLAGAPVVSSNATCLPEVYRDGAHYFDPTSVDDMVSKINEVLINKKLATQLKRQGIAVAKSYSWQTTAKKTLAVYNRVLGID